MSYCIIFLLLCFRPDSSDQYVSFVLQAYTKNRRVNIICTFAYLPLYTRYASTLPLLYFHYILVVLVSVAYNVDILMIKRTNLIACLVILSVCLFTLSFPNFITGYGIPFLSFFALVPLFIALDSCTNPRVAGHLGVLFGMLSTITSYSWLSSYGEFSIWTLGGTAFVYMLYYRLLFLYVWKLYKSFGAIRAIIPVSMAWIVFEHLKSIGFLGFPWNLLGHSFHRWTVLMQVADLGGVLLLSFICVLCNAIFASLMIHLSHDTTRLPWIYYCQNKYRVCYTKHVHSPLAHLPYFFVIVGSLGFIFLYGTMRISYITRHYEHTNTTVSALLVQQNLDSWAREDFSVLLADLVVQTRQALKKYKHKPDIIVWSETSLRIPYQPHLLSSSRIFYQDMPLENTGGTFYDFLRDIDTPLLTGSPLYDSSLTKIYNGSVLIAPDGTVLGTNKKRHLVPFAEILPFKSLLSSFVKDIVGIGVGWDASTDFFPISIPLNDSDTFSFAVPICFEDSFSQVTRRLVLQGSTALINLTNVSWAQSPLPAKQQIISSLFRSVETRVPIIRGTNSGITTTIDPLGRRGIELAQFTEASLFVEVPVLDRTPGSVFLRYGNWFPSMILCFWSVTLIMLFYKEYTHKEYTPWAHKKKGST